MYIYSQTYCTSVLLFEVESRVQRRPERVCRFADRWSLILKHSSTKCYIRLPRPPCSVTCDMPSHINIGQKEERTTKKKNTKQNYSPSLMAKQYAQRRDRTADLTITAMRAIIVTCNSRMLYQLS